MATSLEDGLINAFLQKANIEEHQGRYALALDHLLVANAFVASPRIKSALRAMERRQNARNR